MSSARTMRAVRLALLAACALAVLLAILPRAAGARAAVRATADTFVTASRPDANFGAAARLRVDSTPKSTAYLRFDLRGATARPVYLRLYSLSNSRKGVLIRDAKSDTWTERGLSFSNAPAATTEVVRSGRLRRRHWTAIDITPLVARGASAVNLAITAHGPHVIAFGSRESAHSRPQILLGAPPRRRPAAHRRSTRKKAKRRPAPVSAARPCGVARTAPSYQHVVWVLFENKKYADIIGSSDAPYINALAGRCGLATNFFAESHPSLPNYIAMTSGGLQGIKDDSGPSSHLLGVPSIFSQLGSNWRALAESMPSNCAKSDSGLYAVRHNPAVYFTSLSGTCAQQDVPLSDPPDLSAKFTFITPNSCDDMHSCPTGKDARSQIHNGDTWLSQWAPKLLSTPEYRAGNTVIFITWDEDDYSTNQHIATLVLAPSTPSGTQDGGHYDHYSLLRTTEDLLHLAPLGSAAGASSMRAGFHL